MTLDEHYHEKRGWILLSNEYQNNHEVASSTGLIAGIQSYISSGSGSNSSSSNKKARDPLYAVIKHNTLFVFNSEQEEECKLIIPIHDYNISIYPPRTTDAGIFGRASSILLEPKKPCSTKRGAEEYNLQHSLYLKCTRAIDKEDWYLGLKAASELMDDLDSANQTSVEMVNSTMFSLSAADRWMSSVMRPDEDGHTDWVNGILGRLFLGVYRTDKARAYFEAKLVEKIKKMRRPGFVEQIKVRKVDPGQSVPRLVRPRLVSITPQGMLIADAEVEYDGGLSVEIETDVSWSYSSHRKPIRVQLVLAVKLKTFNGKCMFKIKPPPSNRCWIGFYETPDMTWEFTSVVSEKQIKLQMVMNAMEAKIREIITDSMVLPNMEDFKFMETDGQGGVFGTRVAR
ncbi:putative integral membrane protein conserved region-domain-containing protein, partial [Phycomyces nitens]